MNVSVAGIPKTIDNDVDYIDRSFGFVSAVEAAQNAILCAKTEATCNLPNGIGIVKLMGRSAGFIAVRATLGSGDVDLVCWITKKIYLYLYMRIYIFIFINISLSYMNCFHFFFQCLVFGSRNSHCIGG